MRTIAVEQVESHGSVGVGIGRDTETGEQVRFGGDWRPMRDLAEAVAEGEEPVVEVENWQVLG